MAELPPGYREPPSDTGIEVGDTSDTTEHARIRIVSIKTEPNWEVESETKETNKPECDSKIYMKREVECVKIEPVFVKEEIESEHTAEEHDEILENKDEYMLELEPQLNDVPDLFVCRDELVVPTDVSSVHEETIRILESENYEDYEFEENEEFNIFEDIEDIQLQHDDEELEPVAQLIQNSGGAHHSREGHNKSKTKPATFDWTSSSQSHMQGQFDCSTAGVSPTLNLTIESPELNFFVHFLDERLVQEICDLTNRNYRYYVSNVDLRTHSRLHKWQDITVKEMYSFIAVTLLMTRNKHLTIEEHWSKDNLLFSPIFGKVMTRNRYCMILGLLHFCKPGPSNGADDRLHKTRLLIDHARKKYKEAYTPGSKLRVDESMVPFKGRLILKQYLPNKRHRFGIKMFVLCDVKTNIIIDFMVYTATETEVIDSGLGVGGDVVCTLMRDYYGSQRKLYTDNWYSSPSLFKHLLDNKIYACGTVKKNRQGMPAFTRKLRKGEVEAQFAEGMMALKWKDNKDVYMLSTIHDASMGPSNKLDRATTSPVVKPECVNDYTQNMGSVDTADMMMGTMECIRKTVKWYKKLSFHIFDMHLLNAFYIYRVLKNNQKATLKQFQLEVIRQLVVKYASIECTLHEDNVALGNTSQIPEYILSGNAAKHMPEYIPNERRLQCRMCSTRSEKSIRKRTRYMCLICDTALCVVPCFRVFHEHGARNNC